MSWRPRSDNVTSSGHDVENYNAKLSSRDLTRLFNTAHIRQNDGRSSLCSIGRWFSFSLGQYLKKEMEFERTAVKAGSKCWHTTKTASDYPTLESSLRPVQSVP